MRHSDKTYPPFIGHKTTITTVMATSACVIQEQTIVDRRTKIMARIRKHRSIHRWGIRKPLEKSRKFNHSQVSLLTTKGVYFMLKAKLVLSAVAVMAVVGGAFAFKTARIQQRLYEVDAANPNPALRLCTKTTSVFYTSIQPGGQPTITTLPYFTTAVAAPVCPTTALYSFN
jgi:hypothetical protein